MVPAASAPQERLHAAAGAGTTAGRPCTPNRSRSAATADLPWPWAAAVGAHTTAPAGRRGPRPQSGPPPDRPACPALAHGRRKGANQHHGAALAGAVGRSAAAASGGRLAISRRGHHICRSGHWLAWQAGRQAAGEGQGSRESSPLLAGTRLPAPWLPPSPAASWAARHSSLCPQHSARAAPDKCPRAPALPLLAGGCACRCAARRWLWGALDGPDCTNARQ